MTCITSEQYAEYVFYVNMNVINVLIMHYEYTRGVTCIFKDSGFKCLYSIYKYIYSLHAFFYLHETLRKVK